MVSFFSLFLVACGGGGSIDNGSGNQQKLEEYALTVAFTGSDVVTPQQSATVNATLLHNGTPVSGQIITFSTADAGTLDPVSGKKVTDTNGVASITLQSGTVAGAGTITATFDLGEGLTKTASDNFEVQLPASYSLTARLVELNDGSTPLETLEKDNPGLILVELKKTENGVEEVVKGERITITLDGSVGLLDSPTGTVLTDSTGMAQLGITAGEVAGAGVINLSFAKDSETATSFINFRTKGDGEPAAGGGNTLVLYLTDDGKLEDSNNDGVIDTVSALSHSSPIYAVAKLTDSDGAVVNGEIIRFSLGTDSFAGKLVDFEDFSKESTGDVLTKDTGIAVVALTAGDVKTAGTITASFDTLTTQKSFTSAGDQPIGFAMTVKVAKADDENVKVNTITPTTPAQIIIEIQENGIGLADQIVTLGTSIGYLPKTQLLTDSDGKVSTSIEVGETEGVGTLTVISREVSKTVNLITQGTQVLPTTEGFNLSVKLVDDEDENTEITNISKSISGVLIATLTDKAGNVQKNKVVNFSTTIGNLAPSSGSALTNANGVASIALSAGTIPGAGTVTAVYQNTEDKVSFSTEGNAVAVESGTAVSAELFYCSVEKVTGDSFDDCSLTTQVLGDLPSYLLVKITNDGAPIDNGLVSVSSNNSAVEIEPRLRELESNEKGEAVFKLKGKSDETDTIVVRHGDAEDTVTVSVTKFSKVISANIYRCPSTWSEVADSSLSTCTITNTIIRGDSERYILLTQLENIRQGTSLENFVISPNTGLTGETKNTNASGIALFELDEPSQDDEFKVFVDNILGLSTDVSYSADLGAEPEVLTLDLALYQALDNGDTPITKINRISDKENIVGSLRACLVNAKGVRQPNRTVSFSTSLGELSPVSGTALTSDDETNADLYGCAVVSISAGTIEGAGTATATYQNSTADVSFATAGDDSSGPEPIDFDLTLYGCVFSDPSSIPDGCAEVQDISLTSPGTLHIRVNKKSTTTGIANVLVTATSTIGELSPSNGAVLTNENGEALISVNAGDGSGAGTITVSANDETLNKNFVIGAAKISMSEIDDGLADNEKLAVNSTAVLTVSLTNEEDPDNPVAYTDPIKVQFSSSCASEDPPRAVIDSEVTAVAGKAVAIYRAEGCPGIDIITATATAGAVSLNSTVQIDNAEAATTSIEFVSAIVNNDPDARIISFPGTGDTEQAEITFKALDSGNVASKGEKLCFELTTDVGGISISPTSAFTLEDGSAKVVVKGGRVSTPVRVIATLAKDDGSCSDDASENLLRVRSVSDELTVSTGLPDSNSTNLSLETINVEAWNFSNVQVPVTARLFDHYNNPVPNGTAVSFRTEGGGIEPSCVTSNGVCSVNWSSGSPRPSDGVFGTQGKSLSNGICDLDNDGFADAGEPAANGLPCVVNGVAYPLAKPRAGRASILATAIGEESFIDSNADGYYTGAEPFVDEDGDNNYDAGETYTDLDGNGAYTPSERFDDLDEAFIDFNDDGYFCGRLDDGTTAAPGAETDGTLCREGGDNEEFVDFNSNGTFDKKDGVFSGILCSEQQQANGICSRSLVHVRDQVEVILSGSNAYFYLNGHEPFADADGDGLYDVGETYTDINENVTWDENLEIDRVDLTTANGAATVSFTAFITDINNNPMPSGTTIEISTANGEVVGTSSYTFTNTSRDTPRGVGVSVKREEEPNGVNNGLLTITVTTPNGVASSKVITILDDG
ncbi:hypothetical protein C2869_00210 [Saccharobesus litoralis]|uniref:Big-1 domain-containing protein n=1 Tax=Saccharobesus litoralis TaxID=2172099 RepID=A0A2S0VL78_9ALTE|nr:hypothetical protein C2869_00210 [Saccharobesus litoralis]